MGLSLRGCGHSWDSNRRGLRHAAFLAAFAVRAPCDGATQDISVGVLDLLSLLPRSVLLPPISLLIVAILFWVLAQWRPKLGMRLVGLSLAGLLVMALPVTPALLFAGLESGIVLRRPPSGGAEPAASLPSGPASAPIVAPAAIVILGGDGSFGQEGGAIFGGPQPGSLSLERLRAGAALQRRTALPILLTGGASSLASVPISLLMRQSLQDDFKSQAKWVEIRSDDTWQNAEFTAAILAREGITSVYVVTHPWHLRRAMIAFRHFGMDVWPAPVSLADFEGIRPDMFRPSVTAWLDSYLALHEWVGCAFYALRG